MSDQPEPFFRRYTRLVIEADIVGAMRDQSAVEFEKLRAISAEQSTMVHPPYRWTIRDVVGHMSDTERVMSYRALRFARGDATPLPGFDQDPWSANSNANARYLGDLLDEWTAVRAASVTLFQSFTPDAWKRSGTAAGMTWTIDDFARAVVGHARHHIEIINRRLGQ